MPRKKAKKDTTPSAVSDLPPVVQSAFFSLEKQFGKGILSYKDTLAKIDVERVGSGSPSVDRDLNGGWARGRIAEVYGPESSGKTTLALHAIAEAQKDGGLCAFIDAEHALDLGYAANLGVQVDDLILSQPDHAEQVLETVDTLVRTGAFAVIVVDSVSALVPRKELEGEMGDSHVGLQARLMSQACRKLTGSVAKSNTLLLFINQIRMKIGVMFGSPETTSGGNALKFYASQRVDIRRIGAVKVGDEIIGNQTRVKVIKNKVGPPFRQSEIQIIYGKGVDATLDLLRIGVDENIVDKSGAWYSYEGERLGQGERNVCDFLNEHTEIKEEIRRQVMGEDVLQTSEEEQQPEDGQDGPDQLGTTDVSEDVSVPTEQ